jgi:uncharacterized protein (TIGR03546 family)
MLKAIVRLFKSLNSNSHPGEIAHAVCLGFLLGIMPKNNVLWYIILVFCLFLRINRGALILCTALFALAAPLFDSLLDTIGYPILMIQQAIPVYRQLLDIPFVAFTKFNNTIVIGGIALALAAYIPLYIITRLIVRLWRTLIVSKIVESKFYKGFLKAPIISKIVGAAHSIEEGLHS